MKVKVWDREEIVNECRPNVVYEAYPFAKTRDMLLFYSGEQIHLVADIRQVRAALIKNNVEIEGLTSLQMGEKYLQLLEEENKNQEEENNSLRTRVADIEDTIATILGGEM